MHKDSTSIIQEYLSHSHHFCSPLGSCNVTPLAKGIHLPLNDVLNFTIIPCFMYRLYHGMRRETDKPSLMYNMAIKFVQILLCLEMWLNIKTIWWFCVFTEWGSEYTQSRQFPERTLRNKDYVPSGTAQSIQITKSSFCVFLSS